MSPIVLIGGYVLLNLILVYLTDNWLGRAFEKYKSSLELRACVIIVYLLVAAVPVVATLVPDSTAKFLTLRFSYAYLGFLMYYGGLMVVVTALFFKAKGKAACAVLAAVVLLTAGLNVYGMIHARDTRIKNYEIKIDKKADVDSYRIALITDVHLCFNTSEKMMEKAIDMINEERPDAVMVGGDLFSSSYYAVPEPAKYEKIFRKLKAKDGVYFVYGNHDVEEPLFCGFSLGKRKDALRTKEMSGFVENAGFTPLDDELVPLAGGKIELAGRLDGEKAGDGTNNRMTPAELLKGADKEKPVIVLEHEPVEYEELRKAGADLSLSGHTHAGQVFPGTIVTALLNDMLYAYRKNSDGMHVVVSSGLGFYGAPLRIGTNSEIVIIDLTFDK